jgi:hypothetical protein
MLEVDSPCDNLFLEHRLALELRGLGYVRNIYPVIIGDADDPYITPSPYYDDFFVSGYPETKDVYVEAVESKLVEHMELQALGEPLEKNKTVKATLDGILNYSGGHIFGDGCEAFSRAVESIYNLTVRIVILECNSGNACIVRLER